MEKKSSNFSRDSRSPLLCYVRTAANCEWHIDKSCTKWWITECSHLKCVCKLNIMKLIEFLPSEWINSKRCKALWYSVSQVSHWEIRKICCMSIKFQVFFSQTIFMCDVRVIVTSYFFFSCVIACFGVIIRNYTFCWAILQRQTFILLCVHTSHIAHTQHDFTIIVFIRCCCWAHTICIWQLDSSHLHTQTHTHKEYCHIIWLRRIKQHKKRLNINKQKWESKKTEWKKNRRLRLQQQSTRDIPRWT